MKNDKDTFDYTNPNPGAGMQGESYTVLSVKNSFHF